MTAVTELRGVSASYGSFRVLFDVDFQIDDGEAVALLGSNGSGKSTIARVLTGLVPVGEGRRLIDGRDASGWATWRIRRAGVLHVPEGRGVFSSLSVDENLRVGLLAQPRSARRRLLAETYGRFELLAERRRSRAGTLSGGQQRLLSLATSLVAPPRLLIADELSLGLAPMVLDEIYASLRDLRAAGCSLLVIEQQLDRALGLADRAVVVDHGRVIHSGPPESAIVVMEAGLAQNGDRSD